MFRDANGCVKTISAIVAQPTPVVVAAYSALQPQCSNSADGSVTFSGGGGTPGYTYAVDGGAYSTSGTVTGLIAGSHTLHVKDTLGCVRDSNIVLLAPARLTPIASVRKSTCATLANGRVTLGATGGTAGYTYAQGSGSYAASGVFTALSAGSYTFHVKDTHGCITGYNDYHCRLVCALQVR